MFFDSAFAQEVEVFELSLSNQLFLQPWSPRMERERRTSAHLVCILSVFSPQRRECFNMWTVFGFCSLSMFFVLLFAQVCGRASGSENLEPQI
jgi:hypothetical protein